MAFQSLKNFTRTLTSLVNRNQRKLRVVSITTSEMELDPHIARLLAQATGPREERPASPLKRLGPDAGWANLGEYEAYLEEMDAAEVVAATKVHVVVDWKLPS